MMQNEIFEKDSDFRFSSDELGFTFIKKTKALTNPRRHFHPWWEILYIISGERTFFYGNKTVQAKAGTFLIVAPGVLHRAINPEGETCSLYNIFNESHSDFVLRKNHFDEINSILSTLEPFIQLDEKEIETMNILFQRLTVELSEKKNNFELISRAILSEIIVNVSRAKNLNKSFHQDYLAMSANFSEILEWVNLHFKEELSLEKVAGNFNITASHLSRSFKTYTQFTFIEYVNSLRVSESCKLLHNTKLSVLEISMNCGFGSLTQYGRWFKKLVGKSPIAYRKR